MKKRTKKARIQSDNMEVLTIAQTEPLLPTREQIQRRAYEIFKARGAEPGQELDDWLLAEYELKADTARREENPAE